MSVKVCPRCGVSFECRHGEISRCHCTQIKLKAEQLAYVSEKWDDCLCRKCLEHIRDNIKGRR